MPALHRAAQDELFNFTADQIKATAVQSRLEVKVSAQHVCWVGRGVSASGSLRASPGMHANTTWLARAPPTPQVSGSLDRLQLDNQMMDAVQPVVLAPAATLHTGGSTRELPLITYSFTRSFAGSNAQTAVHDEDNDSTSHSARAGDDEKQGIKSF